MASPRPGRAKKPREWDYSRFKLSIYDSKEFESYVAGYPDKTGLMAYVYRLRPRIDFGLIGRKETNIFETAILEEMTGDFVSETYGRGRYMLKLTDSNRPKGQTEVARTWFKLEDEEKPPVYDLRCLLIGHGDNIDEVNRLLAAGTLIRDTSGVPRLRTEADGAGTPQASAAGTNGNGNGELLTKDTFGQLILKLVDRGSQSPAESIKQSIEIAKLLQPQPQQTAPAFSMDELAERVAAKLRPAAPAAQPLDVFKAYEQVEGFISRVRAPAAVVGGEGVSPWAAALPALLAGAEKLIDRFMTRMEQPPGGRGPRPVQNGAMSKPIMERVSFLATLGFQKMMEGVSGYDFAAYVCNWHEGGRGIEVYRFLEPNGAAGLLGLAAMNPATAPILSNPATRAQVEAFLNDFFTYDPDGGVNESDAAGAPASSST